MGGMGLSIWCSYQKIENSHMKNHHLESIHMESIDIMVIQWPHRKPKGQIKKAEKN